MIVVTAEAAGKTLAAFLRELMPDQSWKQVRQLIAGRHVEIDGQVCLDDARRLKEGETVTRRDRPAGLAKGATEDGLNIRHLDEHVVVVEKPAGVNTVRHPAERDWAERRRRLDPTLEDLTQFAVARRLNRSSHALPRLRIVHRLDKETSGLVVFARTAGAERGLGRQFHAHTVTRRYLAVIHGALAPQTIRSQLVRDRGDGRRGSTTHPDQGKGAVTHVAVEERLGDYTVLSCRLETGRTHQIRIHLSEAGHPVCGEPVYNRPVNGDVWPDPSGAPRLALHAVELGFTHPHTGDPLHWTMPPPADLQELMRRLAARQRRHP